MDEPNLNGHGAVDLGGLHVTQEQKDQVAAQLLGQAGLICAGCGERIRRTSVVYYTLVDATGPSAPGQPQGVFLQITTVCGRTCQAAPMLEARAIARRDGIGGRVTWLDERRAARAAQGEG